MNSLLIDSYRLAIRDIFLILPVVFLAIYLVRSLFLKGILFIISLLYVKYILAILIYLMNLSSDSLVETISFDYIKAIAYLKTIPPFLHQISRVNFTVFLIFLGAILLAILFSRVLKYYFDIQYTENKTRRRFRLYTLILILFLGSTAFFSQGSKIIKAKQEANKNFANIKNNFLFSETTGETFIPHQSPVKLIIYIGESTSTQHMGLYGYYRDTTPQLSAFHRKSDSLLVGHHYLSTHTHTTPSLLEALSRPASKSVNSGEIRKITQQNRISIIEILKASGIKTYLVSNQGQTGTWNFTGPIIFKSVDEKILGSECYKFAGNRSKDCHLVLDNELFFPKLKEFLNRTEKQSSVLFLHSYAGHFPYERNISKSFKRKYQKLFENLKDSALFGKVYGKRKSINSYDSMIGYIDDNISRMIQLAHKKITPTIFLYFADHGESVYTPFSHDSSRFRHPMVRVPMLLYLNNSAQNLLGGRTELLRKHLSSKKVKTLRDIPNIIKALLSSKRAPIPLLAGHLNPILTRGIGDNITSLNITPSGFRKSGLKHENTGSELVTQNFVFAQVRTSPVCLKQANNIRTALLGAFSSSCLEIDIEIENEKTWVNNHSKKRSGLDLRSVSEVVKNYLPHIWIDAKNLLTQNRCSILVNDIRLIRSRFKRMLVEFPANVNMSVMNQCIYLLKKHLVESSYRIPTQELIACAKDTNNTKACQFIKQKVYAAIDNGVQGLSFDYKGENALHSIQTPKNIKLHTWNISHSTGVSKSKDYDFMIPLR